MYLVGSVRRRIRCLSRARRVRVIQTRLPQSPVTERVEDKDQQREDRRGPNPFASILQIGQSEAQAAFTSVVTENPIT